VAQQPVVIGRTAVQLMDSIVKGKPLATKKVEVPLIPVTAANLNSINKTGMQAPKGWTP
jgi:ribose transport system substrate-binding protein